MQITQRVVYQASRICRALQAPCDSGGMTAKDIAANTGGKERTVTRILRLLEKAGAVKYNRLNNRWALDKSFEDGNPFNTSGNPSAWDAEGYCYRVLPSGEKEYLTDSGEWFSEVVWAGEEMSEQIRELQEAKRRAEYQLAMALKAMDQLNEKLKTAGRDRVVEVQLKEGRRKVGTLKGLFHDVFPTVLQLAQARKNIFIFGPTGTGKSHLCGQLAKALKLPFSFISCTNGMSEGNVGGRLLPTGPAGRFEYISSEFVDRYEKGGVFFLDEIDAADPNVLLFINAALAGDRASVPNRTKKPYADRHPDFICIAAANTAGTNGDRMYSGRSKLDASTMDRFQIGKVFMGYDHRIEEALARQKCEEYGKEYKDDLLRRCWIIRQAIEDHRLERAMSTRFIRDAYEMWARFDWDYEALDRSYFVGWREDEVSKVQHELSIAGLLR